MKTQIRAAKSLVLQLSKETVNVTSRRTGLRAGEVACPIISHLCAITIFVPPMS
jgi:hypothetical protein